MGRVDWNTPFAILIIPWSPVSSRMGRVDWNGLRRAMLIACAVSSRMGRVDWNALRQGVDGTLSPSLPVWEEWIEMVVPDGACGVDQGLFPYGKSGLKLAVFWYASDALSVSSRMGRVDWNNEQYGGGTPYASLFPYGKSGLKYKLNEFDAEVNASLPVWEEWIEMP